MNNYYHYEQYYVNGKSLNLPSIVPTILLWSNMKDKNSIYSNKDKFSTFSALFSIDEFEKSNLLCILCVQYNEGPVWQLLTLHRMLVDKRHSNIIIDFVMD